MHFSIFMNVLHFVLTVDEAMRNQCMHMQQPLMPMVFKEVSPDFLAEISEGEMFNNVCRWREENRRFAVWCHCGIIKYVYIRNWAHGPVHIEYLPPTIDNLVLSSANQRFRLCCRSLPRKLKIAELTLNKIYGTPDLACLPDEMEEFFVAYNRLTGSISLEVLPETLQELDLRNNRIVQKRVLYAVLPPGLRIMWVNGNSIGALCRRVETAHLKDTNVNVDFSSKRIF